MNKADLVNEVANVVSSKAEAQAAVDGIFESTVNTHGKWGMWSLPGWIRNLARWSSA